MKSDKKKSVIGSSIKSSFNRMFENKFFQVMFILILVGLLVYTPLVSVDYYLKSRILCSNTKEAVYDTNLIRVSYINDTGKVFLNNGDSYEKEDYEHVAVLSGNEFWYSTEKNILVAPMTWSQSKTNYFSYLLISATCWVTIILMFLILNSMFAKVIKSKVWSVVVFVVSIVLISMDLITMYSVGDILVNWSLFVKFGRYIPIIISSIKVIMLIKYFNWVDSKKRLC